MARQTGLSCGILGLVICSGLGVVRAVNAQEDAPTPVNRPPFVAALGDGFTFSVRPFASHTFEADLNDSPGSSSVTHAGAGAILLAPVTESVAFSFATLVEYSRYHFSGLAAPLGDRILDDALILRLAPGAEVKIDEDWSVSGGPIVTFSGDPNVDIGDALTYGGFVSAKYKFSDTFKLAFGVLANTQLEESVFVIPLLGIEWQITPDLALTTDGPGLRLEQRLPNNITLGVSALYEDRDFRLNSDQSVPEGVLRDTRVPVALELGWRATDRVTLRFTAGAIAYQRFIVDDRDGNRVARATGDPTAFVGLNARIRF